jgi:hypothetical protein
MNRYCANRTREFSPRTRTRARAPVGAKKENIAGHREDAKIPGALHRGLEHCPSMRRIGLPHYLRACRIQFYDRSKI